MQIKHILITATARLKEVSTVPRLEAELLLGRSLNSARSYLYANAEKKVARASTDQFEKLLLRRLQGEPIAYILGEKEFWSLNLKVTPDVLIPRPETELLVELALKILPADEPSQIADLGTGSGAIALSLAHERPNWQLYATDQSVKALHIAQANSQRLNINNINFFQGKWCQALPPQKFTAIISNPPYIAEHDPHLQQSDLRFEPQSALISSNNGLQDISIILQEARDYLIPGGTILLEHGYQQAKSVRDLMQALGYTHIKTHCDLLDHERVTVAQS